MYYVNYFGNYFEWNVQAGTMTKYYYAGAERIAMRSGTGTGSAGLVWILGDHLGSTAITVDAATGAKLSELRFKPWGEVRSEWGVTGTKYKFTGQREEMGGLYFYGARFYDTSIMSFNQPDTLIPDPYDPLDWNRYSYVRNNPIKYTDPTGHCLWDVCISETAIFIALAVGATTVGVSSYYAAGGPEAVADASAQLMQQASEIANQAAERLRSLAKASEPKPLTEDEKKHVDKLTKGIDNFLKEHPDLAAEAEAQAEGEELEYDHVTEAKQFAQGLEKSIKHLQGVRENRTAESQEAIDEAIAHAQEIIDYLWDLLGGW